MFLYLSKILPVFAYPPGLTLFLLLVAALLRKRRPAYASALSFFAVISLWALSTHYLSEILLRSLETRYASVTAAQAPQADVIVVLGGYLHAPGGLHPTAELNEGADRLWMGAKLYREQKAPFVLLTGGNVPMFTRNSMPEAIAAKDLLHAWGVPLDAILVESQSRNTRENAILSKPVLQAKGARRLLLVTSAFHMPRAVAIFRHAGLDVTPIPTDYQSGWDQGDRLFEFLPEAENLTRSNAAFREWLGLTVYKIRGWA